MGKICSAMRFIVKILTYAGGFWLVVAVPCYGGGSGTFTGTWVANGSRDTLRLDNGRSASTFRFSGHVNLESAVGEETDFWSECIGLTDSETGSDVRCVWKGSGGGSISLVLTGKTLERGTAVTGKIMGGSDSFAGISGTIRFHWSTMSVQRENGQTMVGGYAKDLVGAFRLN